MQAQYISSQMEELQKAYYVIGEMKELQEKNIINSQGGMLGMGKTQKMSDNIDNSTFKQIDCVNTTTIPVNCKKPKMLTTHPYNSYLLDKDKSGYVTNLEITNPEKFWSISKYLVIVKE